MGIQQSPDNHCVVGDQPSRASVDQDVLKVLYESVIGADTRKRLGEYYTPDWLADLVVAAVATDPLEARVLDPSCGSGTFLFHAVRRFLSASEGAGRTPSETLRAVSRHVQGIPARAATDWRWPKWA